MTDPNEDRLDEVLRQLEESPESLSKAFGTPAKGKTTLETYEALDDAERREFSRVIRNRPRYDGQPKIEPSRIKPYPNVYAMEGGEAVAWVGFFYDEEAANMWIKGRPGTFMVEIAPRRQGLPMWQRGAKRGRTS